RAGLRPGPRPSPTRLRLLPTASRDGRSGRHARELTLPGRRAGRSGAPPPAPVGNNRGVTSPLSGIAVEKRRQLAATLGLFAMLFVAVGAVAATGATTAIIKGFVIIALLVAVLLGFIAWGVLHSVRLDLADRRLDAAIEAAVAASGQSMCGCGVQ